MVKGRTGELVKERMKQTEKKNSEENVVTSNQTIPTSTCKSMMFDDSKDVIVEAYEELKNSCSYYSGTDQLFKVDVESPSQPAKDIELFYCHVVRLLFTNKRARPDIQAYAVYIFTRIKLPMNYYKDRHLDRDISFVKKT